jgi:uncharacterized membrane protein YjjP (DUF1212 family)
MAEAVTHTQPDDFHGRVRFLTELARRLHVVGVSASRLEGAVHSVALSIGVRAEIWSTPTGLLLSLSDAALPHATQETRVLRLEPGDIQLGALAKLDAIAEDVVHGRMSIDDAWAAMHALDRPVTNRQRLATVAAFGLASAAVAGLLRTAWIDVTVAAVIGLVIGWIAILASTRPNLAVAFEAVAALVATSLATAFAHFIAPLTLQTVIVAALIVLMPGLSLTTAVTELASQQLVTGTTRLAGAMTVLLKLTFGSVAASQLMLSLGWTPLPGTPEALPQWVEVLSMIAAAFSFAVLFRASRRDIPLVMGSAILGYVLTRLGSGWMGPVATGTFAGAVFFSSLMIAALANGYGRWAGRPGSLVRVPGIMLLVPGSVGFRALSFVMERDYTLGFETLVAVLSAILALVAGTLFGSLLVPPRRYL